MPEITNKLTYQDFYSTSSSSSPNIMDNAVSILRNICDYLSDFNNITVSFWQNSTESDLLNTATLSIKKYGYDSFYMITVTTVDPNVVNAVPQVDTAVPRRLSNELAPLESAVMSVLSPSFVASFVAILTDKSEPICSNAEVAIDLTKLRPSQVPNNVARAIPSLPISTEVL